MSMKPARVLKAVEVVHGLEDRQDVAAEDAVAEDVAAEDVVAADVAGKDVVEKAAAAEADASNNRHSGLRKMMVVSRM